MNFEEIKKLIERIKKLNKQNKKDIQYLIEKNDETKLLNINNKIIELKQSKIQNDIKIKNIDLENKLNEIKLKELEQKHKYETNKILLTNFLEQFEKHLLL